MTQKLVIVESPAKAKTIKKFLGRGYTVEASMGHVRDLPKSQLGVDLEHHFEPKYITIRGKGELLAKLKKSAKKADKILLATDPDREGEAISWHLSHVLKLDENSSCRIEFNEITEKAVKNAIKHPRAIDRNLVDAQQARRVLDRVVGYQISPLLWRKVRKGLSAGRVQSVATRLLCDREKEIKEFQPVEYWTLKGEFYPSDTDQQKTLKGKNSPGKKQIFEALLYGIGDKKLEPGTKEEMDKILAEVKQASFRVERIRKSSRRRNAPPPFTTSTLQQEASRKLGFTTKKTMMLAQQLYEGIEVKGEGSVGLITYIRTDSTRISETAQQDAKAAVEEKYGKEFLPKTPNVYKARKNVQDAHEAIRPTYIRLAPDRIKDSLKRDQLRLYRLVYERFLASQMAPALYEVMTVQITAGKYTFRARGSRKAFPGYTIVYMETSEEEKDDKDVNLPSMEEGQQLELREWKPEQHFSQPPPRYSEASLVRAMEDMGIGRPSTYSPTISTILSRGYVVRERKVLYPTELGDIVNGVMLEYFPDVIDYQFTADMEERLDQVEEGSLDWHKILEDFYGPFEKYLEHAEKELEKIEIQEEESDVICENCGSRMVIKYGRYGKFLACPNFPECRNTKPLVEKVDVSCPKCNAAVVVRRSKRGRKFYGCERYPDCDFISWYKPIREKCPKCGSYMVEKASKTASYRIVCSNKECGYTREVREESEDHTAEK
jgi:DNA topoisomerase-1